MTLTGHPADERARLRRVEAVYHQMLERPAQERAAGLVAACPDDPAFAAEVQSLLNQPESAVGWRISRRGRMGP